MPEVIVRLFTSTRVITFFVSIALVIIKDKFPDLGISEKDLTELLQIALSIIAGDTIRPVNPSKPPLIGSAPQ